MQIAARVAERDREYQGVPLKAGQAMIVPLGAANRDPEVFSILDRFDSTRRDTAYVAFAQGNHVCLGDEHERAQIQIVLPRVFSRFPKGQFAVEPTGWQLTADLRGPNQLLVRS